MLRTEGTDGKLVSVRSSEQLKNLLSSHLPDRLKHHCERQMLIVLLFILFGDSFKWGNLFGITEYNWIQGHFADIGLTAQFTTAAYYLFGHKRTSVPLVLLLPPLAFTSYELMQFPHTDYVDVACYFGGSAVALCSIIIYQLSLNRAERSRG